jgi:hypothetical protein
MIPVTLKGSDVSTGATVDQSMLSKNSLTDKHITGAVVFTTPAFEFEPTIKPFLNSDFGTALNQDASFGGTPELIFDGGSGGTEWVGSGNSQWDFSDAGKVTVDHGSNNSIALFEDAGTIDTSVYVALTGKVDLDNYTPNSQDILFQFQLSGSPLGVPVSMNSFIDTGNFAEQSFAIPLLSFGLAGATVNEFTITVQRSAGHNPHISFDDFQIEQTNSPLKYTVDVLSSEVYYVNQINFLMVGQVSGITTVSGSTQNATVPNLSYDKLLGLNTLSNGIIFSRVQNNKSVINITLKDLSDFLSFSVILDHISDGVNTLVTLSVMLNDPIVLNGGGKDELSLTISDDLSGLVKFTALTRGALRSDPTSKGYAESRNS